MQSTGSGGGERQLSSAGELRAPLRAFVLPGPWQRVRIVTDLSPLRALWAVEGLASSSVKVWRAQGAFRLHAKGRATAGEHSWKPEIVVEGTIEPGEQGTVVDIAIGPPRSWEIGYFVFLYPLCALVVGFFIATLVVEQLRPSVGWAALTVLSGGILGLWARMELGPLDAMVQTVVGRLQHALAARTLTTVSINRDRR